jgi:fatty acid desaturase
MAVNLCLLVSALVVVASTENSLVLLLDAAYLAFVFTQIAFIVHDAGHNQIFSVHWKNEFTGIIHANLLLGFSYARWVKTHNSHHGHPNCLAVDPDTDFSVLAFTETQARAKRGLARWITRHQAFLFFPLLTMEAINLKVDCIRFVMRNRIRFRATELLCLAVHFVLYFGFIFYWLAPVQAALFVIVHQMLFGLYLGMVIAPNHIGMPTFEDQVNLDFVSLQVVTARNLRRHWLTDYCFGPLCCQIEHHLFPLIPVYNLRKAQALVRPFCEKRGLPYYESSPLQCYRDIVVFLHKISAPLRARS